MAARFLLPHRQGAMLGVVSTAADMLKWYSALQDTSLLKQSSIDLMFSPDY